MLEIAKLIPITSTVFKLKASLFVSQAKEDSSLVEGIGQITI